MRWMVRSSQVIGLINIVSSNWHQSDDEIHPKLISLHATNMTKIWMQDILNSCSDLFSGRITVRNQILIIIIIIYCYFFKIWFLSNRIILIVRFI